uniref:Bax inhibitor-1 family protein n=1 Tax=Caballeronia sp. BR00000012568055 TaxID=2918761 RepID=UPI0023FA3D9E
TTRSYLSRFDSFLFMGLIGIVIAVLANLFLASTALQLVVSVIGVVVFTCLTAYDTQRIKAIYSAGEDDVIAGKKAIMGALALYLDFLNVFLLLLRLLGNRRRNQVAERRCRSEPRSSDRNCPRERPAFLTNDMIEHVGSIDRRRSHRTVVTEGTSQAPIRP